MFTLVSGKRDEQEYVSGSSKIQTLMIFIESHAN